MKNRQQSNQKLGLDRRVIQSIDIILVEKSNDNRSFPFILLGI